MPSTFITVAIAIVLTSHLSFSQQTAPPCDATLKYGQILELYKRARELKEQQRLDEAIDQFECVLPVFEKIFVKPDEQQPLVIVLNQLGQLQLEKLNYLKAEGLFQRALQIAERASPLNDEDIALSLNNLAAVYEAKGQYLLAEPLMKRAVELFEKLKQPPLYELTAFRNNLAQIYYVQGKLVEAESLYLLTIRIIEELPETEKAKVNDLYAQILDGLGQLYDEKGNYVKAESLYKKAVDIAETSADHLHPKLSQFLNDLGLLYYRLSKFSVSKTLLERAHNLKIHAFGPKHPEVATSLNNLGLLLKTLGSYDEAISAHQAALAIREQMLPNDHPDIAMSLNNLARLFHETGQYEKSERFFKRALAIYESTLGLRSPYVALSLTNLGMLYRAKGDTTQALYYLSRGVEIREVNLALYMATGSEAQKFSYIRLLTGETQALVSQDVDLGGKNLQATGLALTTVLRRKGRVLDMVSDEIGSLRRRLNETDRALLDQITDVRSRLAALVFRGLGVLDPLQYQGMLRKLESDEQQLEAEISARSSEYRAQRQPVSIQSIQQLIPADAALVEFVLYRPFNPRARQIDAFGEPRYAAYVLRKTGEPVLIRLADEAAVIDRNILQLRAKMRRPNQDVRPLARIVEQQVMQPVRNAFSAVRTFLISPDGALNFVPFAALIDENNQYLVQNYLLTYLTTGRDLLRLQVPFQPGQPPVAVANPLFESAITTATSIAAKERTRGTTSSADFSNLKFPQLPESMQEARVLKDYLPSTTLLVEGNATESAFKALRGPLILHVATHGFFLPDQKHASNQTMADAVQSKSIEAPIEGPVENPLLRSGLWLAGANLRDGGGQDDGVLTALETGSLNLDGTELVVLSACQTGVGDLQDGEGVYGLRRALFVAGTKSAVVSLWRVSSDGTTELMTKYYRHLLKQHEGRAEALRQAQLEMLKSKGKNPDRSDPYFWAGFIPLGEWKSLNLNILAKSGSP